jgi:hypothetical protein
MVYPDTPPYRFLRTGRFRVGIPEKRQNCLLYFAAREELGGRRQVRRLTPCYGHQSRVVRGVQGTWGIKLGKGPGVFPAVCRIWLVRGIGLGACQGKSIGGLPLSTS